MSRFSFTVLVVLLVKQTLCADEVFTVDSRGKETRRSGTIVDLKGNQLVLETSTGRTVNLPLDRVQQFDATWSAAHREADAKYESRDFNAALSLYRSAFNEEQRRWVKRKLLAQIIWCQRNTNRIGDACTMFARLAKDDPETPYFAAIPLQWQMKQAPQDVEVAVGQWLGSSNAPALRLMAASWLMAKRKSDALSTLRELGKNPSKNIRGLAVAQMWRSEMLTLQESRISWWRSQIDTIPRELRAGPYFLLGLSLTRFDRIDEAALAFLRVPSMYADDLMLSQKSLREAADALQTQGQRKEAVQLYRQAVELGLETDDGQRAREKLDRVLSDPTP